MPRRKGKREQEETDSMGYSNGAGKDKRRPRPTSKGENAYTAPRVGGTKSGKGATPKRKGGVKLKAVRGMSQSKTMLNRQESSNHGNGEQMSW